MHWLTESWARGRMTESRSAQIADEYYGQLRILAESASGAISELASGANPRLDLADGRVDRIDVNTRTGTVRLSIVQGDLQNGYGTLELSVAGATVLGPHLDILRRVVEDPAAEIWYWELERQSGVPGSFELRFLFWPTGEMDLAFTSMSWSWAPRVDRDTPHLRRIVVGVST